MTLTSLSAEEFALLRRLIHRETGISLGEGKRALVEARLRPRVRALGLKSFHGYYQRVRADAQAELQELVNAITTQTTALFREAAHFDYVAGTLVPAWARRLEREGLPRIRCWSAACSTGEEAYSLAAVLRAALPLPERFDAKVLATDISTRALERVAAGRYPLASVAAVPRAYRSGFVLAGLGEAKHVQVSPELRALVVPRPLNLLAERYPFQGRFDLVLCRNVLIYFDEETRAELVARLARCLAPGGHLVLGLSEALVRVPPGLEAVGGSIYRSARGGTGGGNG